jgi:magnesium chelatase subunit D
LAGRLVFASRATVVPAAEPPPEDRRPAETPPQSAQNNADPQAPSREEQPADADRMEMVVEAARSAIPADLLAQLQSGQATRSRSQSMGRAGARQSAALRGRPIGVRRGAPRGGGRLNVVETLRAAAPWQTVRHRERAVRAAAGAMPRVEVRAEDFRVSRFAHRSETTTIFVVDASGSSAMHRLAEAKGAVELLLQDCYVRRDRVAVIAFRRAAAELMLPPTRSLVRAKRSLAGLPGGGGTPLASAIDAALALAEKVRRGGETPVVILLTDGRANVARDGAGNRARAETDALSAARSLRAAAVTSLLIDTAPHAQPATRRLAQEMGARYLPMPHADAVALSGAARAAVQPSSGARRPNVR